MQNFQDTFETAKRSYISAFAIYMNVPLNICEALSFNIIMLATPLDDRTTTSFPIYSVTLLNSQIRFKSFPTLSKYKLCSSVDVQILSFANLIIFARDTTVTFSLGISSSDFWAALTFLGFMNNFLHLS